MLRVNFRFRSSSIVVRPILLLTLLILPPACRDATGPAPKVATVVSVTIVPRDTIVWMGERLKLNAIVRYSDSTQKTAPTAIWSSDRLDAVFIDLTGLSTIRL